MGNVFKQMTTRPVPSGAEIITRKGERVARWKDRKGKTRTATMTTGNDGADRIITESRYFMAKYRDGSGIVRTVATGCRDEQAARRVLADLERRAELVKAGVITTGEDATAQHQGTPFVTHIEAYIDSLEASGACPEHRQERRRQLNSLAVACSWATLPDLQRDGFERWLTQQTRQGMGARTRNSYLALPSPSAIGPSRRAVCSAIRSIASRRPTKKPILDDNAER